MTPAPPTCDGWAGELVGLRADDAARRGAQRLTAAGLAPDAAAREARLFVQAGLDGMPAPGDLRAAPETTLDAAAAQRVAACVNGRAAGRPAAYVLGRRAFWCHDFAVDERVLTPRPETEHLVEALLEAVDARALGRDTPLRILDLGVGSGAILLSLLMELPKAWGVGVDRSRGALAVARANRDALAEADPSLSSRCALVCGDWARALQPRAGFDLIACNPPYIATAALTELQAEVRDHEPRLALDGGADGLDAYRCLALDVVRLLAPGGAAALEVGAGQAAAVAALLQTAGAERPTPILDLAGHERVVKVMKGPVRAAARTD